MRIRITDEELNNRNLTLMLLGCNAVIMRFLSGFSVEPRTAEEVYHPSHYKLFLEIDDAYKYALTNPFQMENI